MKERGLWRHLYYSRSVQKEAVQFTLFWFDFHADGDNLFQPSLGLKIAPGFTNVIMSDILTDQMSVWTMLDFIISSVRSSQSVCQSKILFQSSYPSLLYQYMISVFLSCSASCVTATWHTSAQILLCTLLCILEVNMSVCLLNVKWVVS